MFDPLFLTVAVLTAILVGFSKAGLLGSVGMVAVPMLALFMPARDAAGIMLPVLIATDVLAVWSYRRDVDWSILKLMLPGAFFGMGLGWALWSVVSDDMVLLFVGIITLLFVLDAPLPLRKKLAELPPPSKPWGAFWGAFSGFTSFVSHTGGPPFQIYVLPRRLPPAIFAGTSAVFFAIVNFAKLIPYYALGQLNPANLAVSALMAPIAMFGVVLGVWLVRRISAVYFYRIAYWLICALARKLIWDGVTGIWG